MDKILILLKKKTIVLYDIVDGKAAVHTVRGEEVTDAEDYELVAESLRENYNDDELADLSVDVVYTACDTEMIKSFAEELLPCGGWQVFEFKKILPEILLKNGKLKPDTTAEVLFDGDAYKVAMAMDGEITVAAAENGTPMRDTDIAAIYGGKFNVFSDKVKLEAAESEKKKLAEKLDAANQKISERDKAIANIQIELEEKNVEISKLNEQCQKLIKEINKQLNKSTKHTKQPEYSFVYFTDIDQMWEKQENVPWVEKDEILAMGGGNKKIIAPQSGFLIKSATQDKTTGVCAGIIVNKTPTTDDIFKFHAMVMAKQRLIIILGLGSRNREAFIYTFEKSDSIIWTSHEHLSKFNSGDNVFYHEGYGGFGSGYKNFKETNYAGRVYYLTPPNAGTGKWKNIPSGTPIAMLIPDDMSQAEIDALREGLTGKKESD